MKFIKKIILCVTMASIVGCHTYYGNSKINSKSNIEKVNKNISKQDLITILGEPARIHKNKNGEIYEYEYHEAFRSSIYYVPMASMFYFAFAQNPFSLKRKVKGNIDHEYFFVEINNKSEVVKTDFYKENMPIKFNQDPCSSYQGQGGCSNKNLTAYTFSYEK